MKKKNKGFMLAETLIVTTFVASVLIFLFIQFTKLSSSVETSYDYNTVEGLYALDDIKEFVRSDSNFMDSLYNDIDSSVYIDITDCSLFSDSAYCLKLFEVENIDKIFVTTNKISSPITEYDNNFTDFINKIKQEGQEPYRIVASFKNSTFATIRFGD